MSDRQSLETHECDPFLPFISLLLSLYTSLKVQDVGLSAYLSVSATERLAVLGIFGDEQGSWKWSKKPRHKSDVGYQPGQPLLTNPVLSEFEV